MTTTRTPEEWRELKRELTRLVENPRETKERKQKAQRILDSLFKNVGPLSYTEVMRHKEGTQRITSGIAKTDDDRWEGIV